MSTSRRREGNGRGGFNSNQDLHHHHHHNHHRGGAPIGAGGVMTPHFSRQRGTGGHNLGIIH